MVNLKPEVSKDLLNQALEFENNKKLYSKSERAQIRRALLKQINDSLNKLNGKFIESIDDLNSI